MKNKRNLLVRTKPLSRQLEGGIFQTEHRSEQNFSTDLHLLGFAEKIVMDKNEQFPYRLAKLSDAGGDLTKRWRILFYVWDTSKQDLVLRQRWIPLKFKTKAQRMAEAKRLIQAINHLLADGYHLGTPRAKSKTTQQNWTWIEAFDWVYQHREPSIRKRSVQTLELIRTQLKVWLSRQSLLHLPVDRVTPAHCDEYMQWLRKDRKIRNATYNNYLGFLKMNFNYLVDQQKLSHSPASRLKPLKTEESAAVHFPDAVKTKLLEVYPEELKILAQYIYYTFIRPGEFRKLQVKHLRETTLFVPGAIAKNRKSQHVLITPAFERLLQQLDIRSYPPHYYLISHTGKPGAKPTSPNYYTSKHLEIRRALELPAEYTLYCWKHTGVTDTYQQTRDIDFVSRQCRHSSLDMTKRYLRGLGLLSDYAHQDQLPDLGL